MDQYLLQVFDREITFFESIVRHNEVEVVSIKQAEDMLGHWEGHCGQVELQDIEFLLREAYNVIVNVELFPMVKFLLLPFLHVVVYGTYFGIALDDRHPNPVFCFRDLLHVLDEKGIHCGWARPP